MLQAGDNTSQLQNSFTITTTREHTSTRKKRELECNYPECKKIFTRKESFDNHLKVHKNERSFICSHPGCDARFIRRSIYNLHIKAHDPEYVAAHFFSCSQCDKKFPVKSKLAKHSISHINEKQLSCYICFEKYRSPVSLSKHVESHFHKSIEKLYKNFSLQDPRFLPKLIEQEMTYLVDQATPAKLDAHTKTTPHTIHASLFSKSYSKNYFNEPAIKNFLRTEVATYYMSNEFKTFTQTLFSPT